MFCSFFIFNCALEKISDNFPHAPKLVRCLSNELQLWTEKKEQCLKEGAFSSVAQSCLTLRLHGLQHARPPCPSPTPRAYSDSYPLSQRCHPTTSFSAIPFSYCLQSFPASGSFLMSQFFASGSQNIGVSASASVPSSEYSRLIIFRIDWLDLLVVQRTLKSLLQHHSSTASILHCSAFFIVQLWHP